MIRAAFGPGCPDPRTTRASSAPGPRRNSETAGWGTRVLDTTGGDCAGRTVAGSRERAQRGTKHHAEAVLRLSGFKFRGDGGVLECPVPPGGARFNTRARSAEDHACSNRIEGGIMSCSHECKPDWKAYLLGDLVTKTGASTKSARLPCPACREDYAHIARDA